MCSELACVERSLRSQEWVARCRAAAETIPPTQPRYTAATNLLSWFRDPNTNSSLERARRRPGVLWVYAPLLPTMVSKDSLRRGSAHVRQFTSTHTWLIPSLLSLFPPLQAPRGIRPRGLPCLCQRVASPGPRSLGFGGKLGPDLIMRVGSGPDQASL